MNWCQLWTVGKRLVARGFLQVETQQKEGTAQINR